MAYFAKSILLSVDPNTKMTIVSCALTVPLPLDKILMV